MSRKPLRTVFALLAALATFYLIGAVGITIIFQTPGAPGYVITAGLRGERLPVGASFGNALRQVYWLLFLVVTPVASGAAAAVGVRIIRAKRIWPAVLLAAIPVPAMGIAAVAMDGLPPAAILAVPAASLVLSLLCGLIGSWLVGLSYRREHSYGSRA